MTNQLIVNELYQHIKTNSIFEIIEVMKNSAIIRQYPPNDVDAVFSVISKPRIEYSFLNWRFKYDNYIHLSDAQLKEKEINSMYEKIENNRVISEVSKDIDTEISNSMGELYHYDLSAAYNELLSEHSAFDVALATALTVANYDWDGRISRENKDWAKGFLRENNIDAKSDYDSTRYCSTHLAIFNGFTNTVRRNIVNVPSADLHIQPDTYLDLTQNEITR